MGIACYKHAAPLGQGMMGTAFYKHAAPLGQGMMGHRSTNMLPRWGRERWA